MQDIARMAGPELPKYHGDMVDKKEMPKAGYAQPPEPSSAATGD